MHTLVFATNNAHKAREVEQILGPDFEIKTLKDIGCQEEIEETEPTLEGICEGHIALEKQGTGGFGYDPVFIPEGFDQSFAELGDAVKNRISHRAIATEKFKKMLSGG